jgi:2-keto-4-pentenoate hydratase/2-oxohepta-3-ene-1,7-dioic acid hydratase in catechol pathway
MGVFIGRTARYVPLDEALGCVAGYAVVNDVSDRGFQNISTQWDKGKGCDTFGPVGPWLVTPDEVGDPQALDLWLELNGRSMQQSNTRHMIFSIAELIANVSRYITLEPGDLIATGTPLGVGNSFNPPIYLKPGDVMRLGVEKLGEQVQKVVPWR